MYLSNRSIPKRIQQLAVAIALCTILSTPSLAIPQKENQAEQKQTKITLERLYSRPYLWGTSPSGAQWSPDGKRIAFLWNTEGHRFRDLWAAEMPKGEPVRLTKMQEVEPIPLEHDERTEDEKKDDKIYDKGISQFDWSPDNRTIAFLYRDDIYLVDAIAKTEPTPLFRTVAKEEKISFSDDGHYLACISGANLWLRDMHDGSLRQLTTLSKEHHNINWYEWSPDSKNLWLRMENRTDQKEIIIPDYTPRYVKTKTVRRSYVGETKTESKTGLISVDGGLIRWMEDWEPLNYVYNVRWSPDGSHFLISEVSRNYHKWKLHLADAETLKSTILHEEEHKRYFTIIDVAFSKDGKTVFFLSPADGYTHLYSIPTSGGKPTQLTKGEWDISHLQRPKQSQYLFYLSYEIDPLEQHAFRISPDGKKKTRLSSSPGFEYVIPSEDGTEAILAYSTPTTPWEYYWVKTGNPKEPRRITHSQIDGFENVPFVVPQHITFTNSSDGKTIHAQLFIPPNLDPNKKYPAVLSCVYANSAKNCWTWIWNHYMSAVEGYVVMTVDFRASYGYGDDFHTGYFRKLGVIDVEEAVSAAQYLKSLGYVDPDRLGIWGWSYGGFLTNMVMFNAPGVFKAAVAVAPVNDWRNYNEWYTRQRLGLPEEEEEIYEKTSPLYRAEGLQGHLLLIHGMQDDNVLFQDTVQLVQKLLEANKDFDVMFYPKDDHSIRRDESRKDVMRRIADYFLQHLGGPQPEKQTSSSTK